MTIIVSDTSCMIDLRKAALLEAILSLPHTFVMPNILFEDELLCLTRSQKRALVRGGFQIHDLPGESVKRAQTYSNEHRQLKLNDCFALALAEDLEGSVLLTGDSTLRRIAEQRGLEVHGVLWVTDELEERDVLPLQRLHDAIRLFNEDDFVFLPREETSRRLRRLARKIRNQ